MSINIVFNKSKNDKHYIDLVLSNVSTPLANGIRRILLNDLPIVGFDMNDVNIINNKTSLHNEYISHRMSLIPIDNHPFEIKSYFDFSDNTRKYQFTKDIDSFTLDIKNNNSFDNSNNYIKVKSNDIKINDKIANEYFKPDLVFTDSQEYILITYLKVNKNYAEEIKLECNPSIHIAKYNASYNPTGTVTYNFVKESEEVLNKKYQEYLEYIKKERKMKMKDNNKIKQYTTEELKEIKKDFMLLDSDRIYKKDKYYFKIESVGNLYPYELLLNSIVLYQLKLIDLLSNIKLRDKTLYFHKNITLSKDKNNYKLNINNEDHTLGNVISDYIYRIYESSFVDNCSYKIIHPLKDNILISIDLKEDLDELDNTQKVFYYDKEYNINYLENPNNYIIYIFEYSILEIIKHLNILKNIVSKEYSIKHTFKIDKYDKIENIININ